MLSLSKGPMKIGLAAGAAPKTLATAGLSLDDTPEGEDEDEHHEPKKRACTSFVTVPATDSDICSNARQTNCADGRQQEDRQQH